MIKWKNIKIKYKLMMAFLLIGILSIMITAWESYSTAKESLEDAAFNHLTSVRAIKAREIESYFNQIRKQAAAYAKDRMIIDAMREFKPAFHDIIKETSTRENQLQEYETGVRNFYRNEYLPRLHPNVDIKKEVDAYWPGEAPATYLQYFYIAKNPNPIGLKANFNMATDKSQYSKFHTQYHPIIRDYQEKSGYEDIILVDNQTGHIVYTTQKAVNFTTSLLTGPFSSTNLSDAFMAARSAGNKGFVKLVDFRHYDASYAAPTSFIACPIFDGDEKIGVLLFQIAIDRIDQVMTGDRNWQEEGLGRSGETYLVGEDHTMRSDSRFLIEDPDNYSQVLEAAGYHYKIIDRIKHLGTTILIQKIKTHASQEAIDGKTGREIIVDYRGVPALSSYSPVNIKDVNWVIITEINAAEAFAPVGDLRLMLFIWGVIITVAISFFALWLSGSISKPIIKMGKIAQTIASGDLKYEMDIHQKDEIGQLAQSFDEMGNALKEITSVTQMVASGDFTKKIDIRSEKDVLGKSINQMTENLQKRTDESNREDWLKTGQNELNAKMSGDQDSLSLTQNVLNFLADYLEAQVGVCYLADDQQRFKLVSSYAYKMRSTNDNLFELGEGLIGQAALEQKSIFFSHVPEDHVHININSGMGESIPGSIFVLPLVFEKDVLGVLAIGTSGDFKKQDIDLLNRVAVNIAVSLNSARARVQMKKLLEKTQTQAEELETQQEELRASNEELEEKTKILQESEEKLKTQSEELQTTNEELEENSQSLERQKAELEEKNLEIEASRADIEEKARELTLASKYKTEFLANMSHELRTPLNSLLILAKMLSDNEKANLTKDQVESAKIILSSGQNLLNLINDVLDLSKVEAGKSDITMEKVKQDALIHTLRDQFRPVATDKGLEFKVEIDKAVPGYLMIDRVKTEQILKNLLSNAFKFTLKGSVTLKVHVPDSDQVFFRRDLHPENSIAFSVTDTGIGIPDDKQKIIFEAFQQADGSTSREFGGTGLGLTISRELADLLGGETHMESKVGQGSTFTLFLPLEREARLPKTLNVVETKKALPSQKKASKAPGTPGAMETQFLPDDRNVLRKGDKSMLVIEDDVNFATILKKIIQNKGYKFLAAGDGKSGLYLTSQYEPSAIILDIVLPDISGLAVLEQLKENLKTRHIPVHIISALDKGADVLNKGAVGHLIKPVSQEAVEEALTKLEIILERQLKELLVVEDNINDQKAIIKLLKNKGTNISSATSGKAAWDKITTQEFDCIILDLGLPDMTGFQLLEQLHSEKFTKPFELAPVIIYTNRELTREEYIELNQYSKSIIIKGVNSPERLLDEVSLFLHSVESALPKRQQKMIRMLHDPDQVLKHKKILLVDDDLPNTFALSIALKKYDLDITIADNGQMALEKLDKVQGIDLVLMDIMMPVMDGYEAITRIRAREKFKKIPIIALTAKAMPEDRAKCITVGANDYLAKPVDEDKLISMLRIWLFKPESHA